MGLLFSRLYNALSGLHEKRILMLGLDAAGKTTTLYKLHLNECVTTIPTIGFNVERVQYKSLEMTVWDVGGQDKIRPLWRHYFQNSDALIWLIDSSDFMRLGEVREELVKVLSDPSMDDCSTVLLYANKQDLPGAYRPDEIAAALKLSEMTVLRGRQWYLQGCSAVSGDGLYDGLDWLARTCKQQKPHLMPTFG